MSIDEQLLATSDNNQEQEEADESNDPGAFREDKRNQVPAGPDGNAGDSGQAFRMAKQAAKKQEQAKDSPGRLEAALDKATAPARKATGSCLKQAWLNAPETFGCTLAWANIHVFLRQVLGKKLFGPLGSEWLPNEKPMAGANESEAGKALGKGMQLGEGCLLSILDLGCLLIIVCLLAIAAVIVTAIENPGEFVAYAAQIITEVIKMVFDSVWGTITTFLF